MDIRKRWKVFARGEVMHQPAGWLRPVEKSWPAGWLRSVIVFLPAVMLLAVFSLSLLLPVTEVRAARDPSIWNVSQDPDNQEKKYDYTGFRCLPKLLDANRNGHNSPPYVLQEGVDFEVVEGSYEGDLIAPGTYNVRVHGIGYYDDYKDLSFEIVRCRLTHIDGIDAIPTQTYTGKPLEPKVVLRRTCGPNGEEVILKEGVDYTLSYEDNVNVLEDVGPANSGLVYADGIGNYEGRIHQSFVIDQADMADTIVTIPDQIYTGDRVIPLPVVTLNGVTLKAGKEYTATYKNNIDVGQATCQLKGMWNMKGTKTVTFNITTKGIKIKKGLSFIVANKIITQTAGFEAPKVNSFLPLRLMSKKQTDSSVTLTWSRISNGYRYFIYGNLANSQKKFVRIAAVPGSKSKYKVKKIDGKKLAKGRYYKFLILAADKNKKVLRLSKSIIVATAGGKYGNYADVKTLAKRHKNKIKLKKGKKFSLKAKGTRTKKNGKTVPVKKYRGIYYTTSNSKVATVSQKGVITAKKKGKCSIYAYAQNGIFARVKVTVKPSVP